MPGTLAKILIYMSDLVFQIAILLVILSVIVSWVGADPYNPLVRTIGKLTEPLYRPFKPLSRKLDLPIDLSPIIVLLLLTTLQKVCGYLIIHLLVP